MAEAVPTEQAANERVFVKLSVVLTLSRCHIALVFKLHIRDPPIERAVQRVAGMVGLPQTIFAGYRTYRWRAGCGWRCPAVAVPGVAVAFQQLGYRGSTVVSGAASRLIGQGTFISATNGKVPIIATQQRLLLT